MKHISASSIRSYQTCPLQFYFNYELKLLQLPNKAFEIGTAYHKCLELFYKGRKIDKILKVIRGEMIKENTDEEIENFGMVRKMFEKYTENPVVGEVLETEKEFSVYIDGINVPLYGFIDRLDEDKIVEYKTTGKDYKEEDAKTIQSKIYCYVVWKLTGKILPVLFSVNNKIKAKNRAYKPQELISTYTEQELIDLEDELREIYKKIKEEKFDAEKGNYCYWCSFGSKGTNVCTQGL